MNKEVKASLWGRTVRRLITHIVATTKLGKKIQDGTIQQKLVGLKWRCPRKYKLEIIEKEHFQMELLSYRKSTHKSIIFQVHGSGYIAAMRNVYRNWAVLYSKIANHADVLSVDYRVAPEYPFPAALEDSVEAYQWLLDKGYGGEIIIVGDSAGGGLAMALGHYLKAHKLQLPKGFVTMSPWVDLTLSGETFVSNFEIDPLFGNSKETLLYNRTYIGESDPKNPYLSPLFGDFTGFPPMLIQVGSYEMLLSDAQRLASKAKKAGVRVKYTIYPGMFHDFQMSRWLMRESRAAWKEIKEFIKTINKVEDKL